jgi:hypothetical protein
MMAGLSDTYENRALDWLLVTGTPTRASGTWIALYTATPTDTTAGTEVANANAYQRMAVTFNAASAGATANAATITWPTATGSWGAALTHWAVVDSATWGAGTIIVYGALAGSVTMALGDVFEILAGDLDITAD